MTLDQLVERGKPATYGQEILRRRARIVARFQDLTGKTVLDFGCGNGAQTIELAEQGGMVTACDIDDSDLSLLRKFLEASTNLTIFPILYDGIILPLPDDSFDVVVSFAVLEHVRDQEVALDEMCRVLKNDGVLLISVPNKWWIFETHGARLPVLPWNRVPFFSWLPRAIHKRFANARIYRMVDIVRLLKASGFDILDSAYMMAPMDVISWPVLQRILRAIIFRGDTTRIPFLATEIFLYCQKSPFPAGREPRQ